MNDLHFVKGFFGGSQSGRAVRGGVLWRISLKISVISVRMISVRISDSLPTEQWISER